MDNFSSLDEILTSSNGNMSGSMNYIPISSAVLNHTQYDLDSHFCSSLLC